MTNLDHHQLTEFLLASQLTSGPLAGGIREGYDPTSRRYQFVYHETTGYLATFLSLRAERLRDGLLRERARMAGEFLLRELTPTGLPYKRSLTGEADNRFFVFDNAIAMQGLLDLGQLTGEERFSAGARAVGEWIRTQMIDEDGTVHSYWDSASRQRRHVGTDFADDDGVLHAKNAIAWLKLARTVRGPARRAAVAQARLFLDRVAGHQRPDGAFPAQPRVPGHVFSHAHCYATEGYVVAAHELGDDAYVAIAQRAAAYLVHVQARDGGIYQYNRSGSRAADATAQAVRIWQALEQLTGERHYERSMTRAIKFLRGQRDRSGGLNYTRSLLRRDRTAFTWVAMFAASAATALEVPQAAFAEVY